MMKRLLYLGIAAAVLWWASTAAVQVDETEFVVVTQFGKPIEVVTEAGLRWKWPEPIQSVIRFDRRLQLLETPGSAGGSSEFLTKPPQSQNVVVGTYTAWRIAPDVDSISRFMRSVRDISIAEKRLSDQINSQVGTKLAAYDFHAFVNTDSDQWRWPQIVEEITAEFRDKARNSFGIEVVDFQITRFGFPDTVRASVFDRMRSERATLASTIRGDGEREYTRIVSEANVTAAQTRAKADEEAARIRGEADAEAARIYGDAYGRDPEFYDFLQSLKTFARAFDNNAVLIFSANTPFLRPLLEQNEVIPARAAAESSTGSAASQPIDAAQREAAKRANSSDEPM